VVYLDIDHFKTINDEQGHLVGDQVLAAVAVAIQRQVRAGHLVARLGGEEFVVVAPGMTLAVAREMAEGLRRAFPVAVARETGIRVTASFGVAVLHHDEAPTAVLERVDALMYQAKRAGRDTVVVAAAD
jgi:diguanylate cyclase (GGDEF)-like protein